MKTIDHYCYCMNKKTIELIQINKNNKPEVQNFELLYKLSALNDNEIVVSNKLETIHELIRMLGRQKICLN